MEIIAVKHEEGFSVKITMIFKFHFFQGNEIDFYYPFFIIMIMKEHREVFCLLKCLSNYCIQYMLRKSVLRSMTKTLSL